MANKMADKKKNAGRVQQMSEPEAVVKASTSTKEVSSKAIRETRKEQPKQETRSTSRREAKDTSLQARFRNSRIGRFIIEAYYELRHKVTWPTTNEARNMTIIVVLLSAAVAVILALADLGLYHLFLLISGGK